MFWVSWNYSKSENGETSRSSKKKKKKSLNLTHRFPIFVHHPTCFIDLHSGDQYKRGHGNEWVGAHTPPPPLPADNEDPVDCWWAGRPGVGSCLAEPQHTHQTLWIKHTMEAVGLHRVSLPAGWTAIKSPGSGGSAQLDCCALPTFWSGLLAGERDDITAGWGAAEATGASSDSDLPPCPLPHRPPTRGHGGGKHFLPCERPCVRCRAHWQTQHTGQANTQGGGKATAPVKQAVSLGGRLPVKATKRSSQTQPSRDECAIFCVW